MNELLQKHGCSNVFSVPEGLKELMADISREVLRDQPPNILEFISNYLSVLLITREHGILAVKLLEDLCDCRPTVSEHLLQLGFERPQADVIAEIVKEEIEGAEPVKGKEKVKECQILKKILTRSVLDEDLSAKVCQVARNAYRDYWYRKKVMEKDLTVHPEEPWEIAAEHTLNLYKKTKPSFSELTRATTKIQAAYRGYHVRRNVLRHLKPKQGAKEEIPGPPIDIAESREIDLGPIVDIQVKQDDVNAMFDEQVEEKLGIQYDHKKTVTHMDSVDFKPPYVPIRTRSMNESFNVVDKSQSLFAGVREASISDIRSRKSRVGYVPDEDIDADADADDADDADVDADADADIEADVNADVEAATDVDMDATAADSSDTSHKPSLVGEEHSEEKIV